MATESIIAKYDLDLKEIKVKIAELEGGYQKLETKGKKAFDDVSASANKTGKEISNSDKLVSGLAQRLIAAFAIERVIAFGAASVRAFREAEINATRLEFAVTKIGKEGDAAFQKLIKQSAKLQTISIFSDDDIQKAQAQLIQFGLNADQVEKLIPQILDLAVATGSDLGGATDKAIAGINGVTRGLREVSADFKDTGDKTQNLALLMEGLNGIAGTSEAILDTSAGGAARLGNAFGDLTEKIGESIVKTLDFFKVTEGLNKLIKLFTSSTEKQKENLEFNIQANLIRDDEISKVKELLKIQEKTLGKTFDYKKSVEALVEEKQKEIQLAVLQLKIDDKIDSSTNIKIGTLKAEKEAIKSLLKEKSKLGLTENEKAKRDQQAADAKKKLLEQAAKDEETTNAKIRASSIKADEDIKKIKEEATEAEKIRNQKAFDDAKDLRDREEASILAGDDKEKPRVEKEKQQETDLQKFKIESAITAAQTIADAAFEIESNNIQKDQERALEDLAIQETQESQALDNKEEKELSRKNLTETQKKLIQDKYDKLRAETQKKFDQKELEVKKKAFEDNKSLSIKQAILNGALAITKILADVPKFDFGVATAILVGLAVAQTSAQIAVINAQKFAKGTDFVQRGNSPKGIDTIPAYVNEGEAIIPTDKNKKYHDYTKHMISGTLEDYINQNNVMPALQSYVAKSKEIERKSTAQAMADSIVLNNQINEYAMTRAVSKGGEGRSVNIANHKALAKSLANEMNKNNNFF